jgi:hemerythrin superfamily protein
MKIYAALKRDHEKLETLLDKLVESSETGDPKWRALVDKIRNELIPHSRAEEAVFYNAIREFEHAKGLVAHSYGEHAMAEAELRTLQAMETIDANWTTLAKKLRTDLLHHVEEEEGKIFAAAKMIFSDEEADKIGDAFEQLKPYVQEQSIAGTTLDLIINLLPQRLVTGFRKRLSRSHGDEEKKTA